MQVRLQSLRLLTTLGNLFGDELSSTARGERRVVDDIFEWVCNAVMDIVVPIRVNACQLLGELRNVGEDYIVQAFSKKPLSIADAQNEQGYVHPSERRTDRQKSKRQRIEGADSSVGDSDMSHRFDSGALGAFVHGLEDEFSEACQNGCASLVSNCWQVRLAAISSICLLACERSILTRLAVFSPVFLLDELNV